MILAEYLLVVTAALLVPAGLLAILVGLRRRERAKGLWGFAFLALSALLWWRFYHAEFWTIDRCLDAGGRYDYQARRCVLA